jgi:hypothetical protein
LDLFYKNYSKKGLYKEAITLVKRTNLVRRKRRGRPPTVHKHKSTAYILLQRMDKSSYRDMELEGDLFLPHKYDHSSYQYQYTTTNYLVLELLTRMLCVKIEALIGQAIFNILDTTGVSTTIKVPRLRQGTRQKEKLNDKLHIFLGYDPPHHVVYIKDTLATSNHVSDSQGGLIMTDRTKYKGDVFGDSAYQTYELIEQINEQEKRPFFKPAKKKIRKTLTPKARWAKDFHLRLYQEIRGLVETPFGGATKKNLLHTYSKLEENRRKDSLLVSLRQNFLTYLRLKVLLCLFDILHKKKTFIYQPAL